MRIFTQLLFKSFENQKPHLKDKSVFYICFGGKKYHLLQPVLESLGFHVSSRIVWVKNQFILGRSDYHTQWEFLIYGWQDEREHNFYGGRDQSDVWEEHQEVHGTYLHPTMKPIKLVAKAVKNSSKQDDIILDNFGGSGSTLMASEQTARTCYMMEIDPRYCDVIRKRYANFINRGELWQENTPKVM